MCGTTTCVLPLVPSVPLSSIGLRNDTHRSSTYSRASTLSSAVHTPSRPSKNVSVNTASVSAPTRSSLAVTRSAGFIAAAAAAAAVDLALPMSDARNRNWRLRLLFSI